MWLNIGYVKKILHKILQSWSQKNSEIRVWRFSKHLKEESEAVGILVKQGQIINPLQLLCKAQYKAA